MRVKTIKLLIFGTSTIAALAMAGRVYWFWQERETLIRPESPFWEVYEARVRAGKADVAKDERGRPVDPSRLNPDLRPVHWWWWEHRQKLLTEDNSAEVQKVPESNYAFLGDLNFSGMPRPKPPEPERPQVASPKDKPYDLFKNVKVVFVYELFDDGQATPFVRINHKVEPPRAALADEGKVEEWDYTVGDSLRALPEIKVESIDLEEGKVVFRMPKIIPKDGFGTYQGTEEDSQLQTVSYRGVASGEGLVPTSSREASPEEEKSLLEETRELINPATNQPFPERTTEVPGTGVWDVGTMDYAELQEVDYQEAFERDVKTTSYHRGGVTGVQVNKLRPGSIFAGKGILTGDVVTSIGDREIRSQAEAVRYFRENPNRSVYHISIFRNGRPKQLSYRVPRR